MLSNFIRLVLPVKHVSISGSCEIHPEEPRQEKFDDLRVEEDELSDPELPPIGLDRGRVRVLARSAPVCVPPGLYEGQPGLQHQSEAGVVRPVGEDVPEQERSIVYFVYIKDFYFLNKWLQTMT